MLDRGADALRAPERNAMFPVRGPCELLRVSVSMRVGVPHHRRPSVGVSGGRSWTFLSTFGENCPRFLKNLSKLTFEYPHKGPCVVKQPVAVWVRVPKGNGVGERDSHVEARHHGHELQVDGKLVPPGSGDVRVACGERSGEGVSRDG